MSCSPEGGQVLQEVSTAPTARSPVWGCRARPNRPGRDALLHVAHHDPLSILAHQVVGIPRGAEVALVIAAEHFGRILPRPVDAVDAVQHPAAPGETPTRADRRLVAPEPI